MMKCNSLMRWLARAPKITNCGITDEDWHSNVELIMLKR